jgi:hypothetical protein
MGWIRMTRIGATQAFYDSRKDELTPSQLRYITRLEAFRNRQQDPSIRKRIEGLISAAYERMQEEREELILRGICD